MDPITQSAFPQAPLTWWATPTPTTETPAINPQDKMLWDILWMMEQTWLSANMSKEDADAFAAWLAGKVGAWMAWVQSSLEDKYQLDKILSNEQAATTSYLNMVATSPGLALLKKQYKDSVNTDDINYTINKLQDLKATAYTSMMKAAQEKWMVVNPYDVMQEARKTESFYTSMIGDLIDTKDKRFKDAEDNANINYEASMKKISLAKDMLEQIRNQKKDAIDMIRDGKADYKWLTELESSERRAERSYNMERKKFELDSGMKLKDSMIQDWKFMQDSWAANNPIVQKYMTEQSQNQKMQIASQVMNWSLNVQDAIRHMQATGKLNGYTEVKWMLWVIDRWDLVNEVLGKKWGTLAWRNNKPGNIVVPKDINVAKEWGAVWVYKSSNGRDYLMFPSMEAGYNAMINLITSEQSWYRWLTLQNKLNRWVHGDKKEAWDNRYGGITWLKSNAPELLSKTGWFTEQERKIIQQAIQIGEGIKEWTYLSQPTAAPAQTVKLPNPGDFSKESINQYAQALSSGSQADRAAAWKQLATFFDKEYNDKKSDVWNAIFDTFPSEEKRFQYINDMYAGKVDAGITQRILSKIEPVIPGKNEEKKSRWDRLRD